MILTSIFIVTWLVIVLHTPSPSSSEKHGNKGFQRKARKPTRQRNGSEHWPKPPRIRILDVDESLSEDKEERRRELQLRDAKHDVRDTKYLTLSPYQVPDTRDRDSQAVLSIESDLIAHELPEGARTLSAVWNLAGSWVNSDQITPQENPDLGAVLKAMATRPIIKADVGYKGTQLKARLELSGGQWVVFKPGRCVRMLD